MSTTTEGGANRQKQTSWRVSAFVFLSCWTWILRLKDTDTPPELVKTWHLGTEHSLQVNGPPLIATEHLLWLRPSPHVAKLPSGVPAPVAPISYLQGWRKSSRVNKPTAEVLTLLQRVEYKIPSPTWEENNFHSFLTLPSLQANTCSCLPQAHCQFLSTVWLKGLHCTQCEGQGQCSPARPQPVVGEAEGSQR